MKKNVMIAILLALFPALAQDAPAIPLQPERPPGTPPERHGRMQRPPRMSPEIMGMLIMGREMLMSKYDTDKDGRLSEQEREAVKADVESRKAEFLKKYDVDGDGKLSPAELKSVRDAWVKNNPELEEQIKGIAFAILASPERRRQQGDRSEGPRPNREQPGTPAEAPKPDRPGNERGDRPQRPQGDRDRGPRFGPLGILGAHGPQDPVLIATVGLVIDQYDKDKDGVLSAEEFKAFTDAARDIMEKRRQEMERRREEMIRKYDKDGDGKLSSDERKTMWEERRKPHPEN